MVTGTCKSIGRAAYPEPNDKLISKGDSYIPVIYIYIYQHREVFSKEKFIQHAWKESPVPEIKNTTLIHIKSQWSPTFRLLSLEND